MERTSQPKEAHLAEKGLPLFTVLFSSLVGLLCLAPFVIGDFYRALLSEIIVWGLFAMSLDILIGYTGMVSFGHAVFFGLGAYGTALSIIHYQSGLWLAILVGMGTAGMAAVFIGFISRRLGGIYFAITTLVFSEILYRIIFAWTSLTGGENGLNFHTPHLYLPGLINLSLNNSYIIYFFILTIVIIVYLAIRRITCSPFGKVLESIRENEERAQTIGYNVDNYKLLAVVVSGLVAGLSGSLYALLKAYAAADFLFFIVSGEGVIWNVLGGIGTLVGPMVGAGIYIILREVISSWTDQYLIVVGSVFVFMVIFFPQGIVGYLKKVVRNHLI